LEDDRSGRGLPKIALGAHYQPDKFLWELHLVGYNIKQLAAESGHDADYLGKRLRRAAERALRRLLLKKVPTDKSSVSDNNVAHG
jgi:hypothetical protein